MFIDHSKMIRTQLQKYINKKKKAGTDSSSKKTSLTKNTAANQAQGMKINKKNNNFLKSPTAKKKAVLFGKRRIRSLLFHWPNDLVYRSPWVNKLTNKIMIAGKKGQAEQIVSRFMIELNQISLGNPHVIFHEVLENLKPALTVVTRRVGRRYYQVPVPVKTLRQYTLALSWILAAVKENPRTNISELLTEEFLGAYFFKQSEALRKKEHLYQTVIKNRAFNHYRWI